MTDPQVGTIWAHIDPRAILSPVKVLEVRHGATDSHVSFVLYVEAEPDWRGRRHQMFLDEFLDEYREAR